MRNIIVMGPPGSGKDTQVEAIKEHTNSEVISSGDITRSLAANDPKIAEILKSGGLLDDALITKQVDAMITNVDSGKGIIFDGFPRTMIQAEKLNELLVNHRRTLDAVIYLVVSEEEVVKRLSIRKICPSCGLVLTEDHGKCSNCGAELVKREDDEPAVIINRMQTFLDKTMPLVSYYRNKGILLEINGEQPIENVTEDILKRLEECETTQS